MYWNSNISIYGDSTVDGRGTNPWIANAIDSSGDSVANHYHNDESPVSWPSLVDSELITRSFNNGYQGTAIIDDWAQRNALNAVIKNSTSVSVKYVFIAFGINDISRAAWSETLYLEKYNDLIDQFLSNDIIPVIVTSDPVSNRVNLPESLIQNTLVPLQRSIAASRGLRILDLNAYLYNWSDWRANQPDGLHFNNAGHQKKSEFALDFIRNELNLK
ncbi:MAG: SGNH/GDSL hydrolase family protein [Plesiomonas shigelloides]